MRSWATSVASAIAAPTLTLVALAPVQAQSAGDGPAEAQCDAEFQPGTVVVQQESVTVRAYLSEPVARVIEVVPEGESGLAVESFRQAEDPPRPGVVVTLDTSGASEGEWTVSIESESIACEGVLTVRQPEEAAR